MAIDGGADFGASTVSFGGTPMTPLAIDGRAAIFTLDNPGTTPGDIFVSLTAGSVVDIFSWGTLSGYNSYSGVTLATPSTVGTVHTITNTSLNPGAGDYVISAFDANGYYVDSGVAPQDGTFSSNMDSILIAYETGGGQHMGGIAAVLTRQVVASAGAFSPQLVLTGDTSATVGNTSQVYGVSLLAVVPEPSTYALWGGILALGFILLRRRCRAN